MGWKRTERTENSSSCANVLHRTLNLVISRRHLGDDGKEMYQNVKRTCRACRAIVFAHQTYCFVASSLPSASSFRKLPNLPNAGTELDQQNRDVLSGDDFGLYDRLKIFPSKSFTACLIPFIFQQ